MKKSVGGMKKRRGEGEEQREGMKESEGGGDKEKE